MQRFLSNRRLLAMLLVALGGGLLPFARCHRDERKAPTTPSRGPNILWIVWDTVRADHMSLHGYGKPTTPKLDAWAKGARVFTDCRSAAGYTIASHGSMFTGLLPSEHGAHNGHEVLEDCHATIAELLRSAGYQTYLYSANPNVSKFRNMVQGFEVAEHPWDDSRRTEATQLVLSKLDPNDRSTELPRRMAEGVQRGAVLDWDIKATGVLQQKYLLQWLGKRDTSKPYFAFLNYMEAHRPHIPTRDHRDRMMSPEQVDASYKVDRSWLAMWEYVFGLREYTAEELAVIAGTYDATLAELDDLFADLLTALSAGGYLDDTIVILTSDHGEHLGEHHLLDHQYSVYEPLLRVPLVVHFPAKFQPGRDDNPVMSMDIFPTLLELGGAQPPPDLYSPAISLLHPVRERARFAQEPALSEAGMDIMRRKHPDFDPSSRQRKLTAMAKGPAKIIWGSDGRHEMYDLAGDPAETTNLAPAQTARAETLVRQIESLSAALRLRCDPTGKVPPLTDAEKAMRRSMLSGLGYVGDDDEAESPGDEPASATPSAAATAKAASVIAEESTPGSGAPAAPPTPQKLNVLLVTLDTARADRFSMYGHKRNGIETTPHFDALAKDGVRFDLAMSTAGATPISHASIMTGLVPPRHGVRVMYASAGYKLDPKYPTMASILKGRGYKTAAVLSAFPVSKFYGFDHGFDMFDSGLAVTEEQPFRDHEKRGKDWNVARDQRRSDATTDRFLEWLPKTSEPFFAWVHYWDPHDMELRPPPEWSSRFVPARPANERETKEFKRAVYDAELAYVDLNFGRLIDALKKSGQYERTIIVVIADHGEGLGDHGWDSHRIVYQEQIRVPLIMRIPGAATARVVPDLVRSVDVLPTVLDLLAIEPPAGIDGRSLSPLLKGAADPPRTAYAEAILRFDQNAAGTVRRRPDDALLHVAMDREWKFVFRPEKPEKSELFHLAEDPGELKNLYRADHEQVVRLRRLFPENCFVNQPFGAGGDASVKKTLAGLGYLGEDDDEEEGNDDDESDTGPATGTNQPEQPTP